MPKKYDFGGYVTRNDLECADGRVIRRNAFKDNDGEKVPLVWNHQHDSVKCVLGHAILENRENGVYGYCTFNNTDDGKAAKEIVQSGDLKALSIYANNLKQLGRDVVHGCIREVSLCLAGANPEAYIDCVMAHSADGVETDEVEEFEASWGPGTFILCHSDEEEADEEEKEMKDTGEEKDVLDEMGFNDDQKEFINALVEELTSNNDTDADEDGEENDEEDKEMAHNIFEQDGKFNKNDVLVHSMEFQNSVITDGKKYGSMKDSFLAHAEEYGIQDLENYLFPEFKQVNGTTPEFIKRDDSWVSVVMNGVKHSPFSRIKTVYADITEDAARAKGYFKGNYKKEEVFGLLKRQTGPTTIYKKQKMDRDDVQDITGFDVIAWLKGEMRMMLDEEIARAILVGDGRLNSDEDKINEGCVRPIYKDDDLFTIKYQVDVASGATEAQKVTAAIDAAVLAQIDYDGSGNTILFTTKEFVAHAKILKDSQGYRIYKGSSEIADAMSVNRIVEVPVMKNMTGAKGGAFIGLIVDLKDYTVGADKGGSVNLFDDFDIDYNQQKYLIETRCSGALTKPKAAIALEYHTV